MYGFVTYFEFSNDTKFSKNQVSHFSMVEEPFNFDASTLLTRRAVVSSAWRVIQMVRRAGGSPAWRVIRICGELAVVLVI